MDNMELLNETENKKTERKNAGCKKQNAISMIKSILKTANTKVIIIAIPVILVCMFAFSYFTSINNISEVENIIFQMTGNVQEDEDLILDAYQKYEKLSNSKKREVQNRETLITAYTELQEIIQTRKASAAQVDELISAIDYSDELAQADSTMAALIAYDQLEEQAQDYVKQADKLYKAQKKVENLCITVNEDNFYDYFAVEYAIGENQNYGIGTVVSQSGYRIDWDYYGGSVTPEYDYDFYNDYAIPVYIYVAPKYENLASSCSFDIDLHQTYQGIGAIDTDTHEYAIQQGTIQYDSSMGIGEYCICVEDNDSSNSLLSLFGMSFDFNDMVHSMNDFDVTRVEITNVKGFVSN